MTIHQEIQRLKGLGETQRKIPKTLRISKNTVKKYWDSIKPPEDIPPLPDWANALDWDYVDSELKRTSRKILFEELQAQYSLPHHSNFCRHIHSCETAQKTSKNVTMRIREKPWVLITQGMVGLFYALLEPFQKQKSNNRTTQHLAWNDLTGPDFQELSSFWPLDSHFYSSEHKLIIMTRILVPYR